MRFHVDENDDAILTCGNRFCWWLVGAAAAFPNGQVPVLEFQGRMLTESAAIARFLARRHGLVGRDDFEAALIDAAVDTMSDLAAGDGGSSLSS